MSPLFSKGRKGALGEPSANPALGYLSFRKSTFPLGEKKVDSMNGSQPEQEAKGLDGAAKAFELPSEASFKDLDSFVVTTLISAYFLGLLQFLLLD